MSGLTPIDQLGQRGTGILRFRRPALEVLFVATEAVAWFIAIAVVATMVEQAFLRDLADRLQLALGPGALAEPARAEVVIAALREQAGRDAGPALYVVLAAAAGGFALMRATSKLDLGPGLGSAVLVAASILGVNVLLHLAIGDLRIWDASRLIALANDPASQVASGVDLDAFVANPDVEGPHGSALAVTFVGLAVVWFRFMLAARSPVRLERMARSFTASFVVVLVALFVARLAGVDAAGRYAVPQFVLGMLGLAIGNHERAVSAQDEETRTTPWMTSVGGTLGLLIASALAISALAYLEFGAVLSAAGELLLAVLEIVLIVIFTPIYWIFERVISLVLGDRDVGANLTNLLREPIERGDLIEEGEEPFTFPGWVVNTVKFFAGVAFVYVMYWIGRRILGSRTTTEEPVLEERVRVEGGAGIGRLLSDLISFRRRPDPGRWFTRHPAYRLFGRALEVSETRGLAMLPSETPAEFGHAARRHLHADPVAEAARLFERLRYGRHDPDRDELRAVSRSLDEWERENPPSEETRERIRGQRPVAADQEVRMKIALAKRGFNPTDESILRGE